MAFRLRLHPTIRFPFLVSYLLAASTSFLVFAFYLQLPPVIPLFYTLAELSDQLVAKQWFFIFPLLAVSISIIHTVIVSFLHEYGQLTARLFAWSTVIVQLLMLLSLVRIMYIVS